MTSKIVGGYYTEWGIYHQNFGVNQIPVDKITHLFYAFMLPNPSQSDYNMWASNWAFPAKPYDPSIPTGTLVAQDAYANEINISNLKTLKARNPNLKILISIGGWSMSFNLSTVFADPTQRKNFVTSAVKFIVTNNFDGLDIDWEFVGVQGIGFNHVSDNDPASLAITLKELRDEFAKQAPGRSFLLSAAVGANPQVILNHQPSIPFLDFINLMGYDFSGAWGNGGHLSALYHNPKDVDTDPQWCVSAAIQNAINVGFSADKIVLGLPMYARGWNRIVPYDSSLPIFGQSTSGPGVTYSGAYGEPGLTDWKDMINVINKNGLNEYYDPVAMAPFVHNQITGETWTYDNPNSITLKTQYALDNNLGGVFFWELAEDTRNGVQNLLSAAVDTIKNDGGNPSPPPPHIYNLNVKLTLTQTSSLGGTGVIAITNNDINALSNWSFQLSTNNFTIQNFSQLSFNGSGNNINIIPLTTQPTITSGQTISSSFNYTGSGVLSAFTTTQGVNITVESSQNPPLPPDDKFNFIVKLESTQNWGGAGNGTISITNNTQDTITNWSFQLTTNNFTIQNFWALSFNAFNGDGNNIIITPASWQTTINAGQTITSGFSYVGSAAFIANSNTDGVIVITPDIGTGDSNLNILVTIKSTQHWGSGGNGEITIVNASQNMITDWNFQLSTTNFIIQNFWTLQLSGSGNNINIKPASWQPTLNPGQQIISGFSYEGTSNSLQASSNTPGVNVTSL